MLTKISTKHFARGVSTEQRIWCKLVDLPAVFKTKNVDSFPFNTI
jgi:hypothetical protein